MWPRSVSTLFHIFVGDIGRLVSLSRLRWGAFEHIETNVPSFFRQRGDKFVVLPRTSLSLPARVLFIYPLITQHIFQSWYILRLVKFFSHDAAYRRSLHTVVHNRHCWRSAYYVLPLLIVRGYFCFGTVKKCLYVFSHARFLV